MEGNEQVPVSSDIEGVAANGGDDSTSGASAPTSQPTSGEGSQAAPAAASSPAQGDAAGSSATTTVRADVAMPNKRSMGGSMLHSIMEALGGTEDRQYSRDASGKLVVSAVKSGPGSQWKRIMAGALKGAAAGAGVRPGPGNKGRAAAAGIGAGMDYAQEEDTRKRKQADDDFEAQQKATATKAQTAHINQLTAESMWRTRREGTEFDARMDTLTSSAREHVNSDPNNEDLGHFSSFSDFLGKHGENGELMGKMNANQELVPVPIFKDGKSQGVEIYRVNKGWNDQRNAAPVQVITGAKLNKDGSIEPVIQTVPANSDTNRSITDRNLAALKNYQDIVYKKAETKAKDQEGTVTEKDKFKAKTEKELEGMRQKGENERAESKGEDKPVYAFDPTSNKTILTTKGEAKTRSLTGVREVKQSDIRADSHDIRVLNDVSLKARNVSVAAGAMDDHSWKTAGFAAKYLADHPNTTAQGLLQSKVMKSMTPQAQKYVISVLNLRESSMGLQKVLTGSARQNETQLQALINTLPGVEPSGAITKQKLDNFTQNITMLRQGLPELPGMETVKFDPAQHVFSKSAWQKANPKGDVDAAVKVAQGQGFEIKD